MHNKMGVLVLIPLLFLLFSVGYSATFTISSPVATANDTIWNSTDTYASYFSSINPYGFSCNNLNECYLDDTNTGAMDDDFLLNFFLGNDSNYLYNSTLSFKTLENGSYYLIAFFRHNITNKYAIIIQRVATYKIYLNMSYTFYVQTPYLGGDCSNPQGVFAYETDEFRFVTCSGNTGYNLVGYKLGYFYNYARPTYPEIFAGTFYSGGFSSIYNKYAIIKYHYPKGSLNAEEVGYAFFQDTFNYGELRGSDTTNFTSPSMVLNYTKISDRLLDIGKKYSGFKVAPQWALGNAIWITLWLKSHISSVNGQYGSIALPLCTDFASGNIQTSFTNNGTYWLRGCSGILPEAGQVTCERECYSYSMESYSTETKVCGSVAWNHTNWASPTYWCHITPPIASDGHPVIFPEGTDFSKITDVQVLGYLNYTVSQVDGINQTHYLRWRIAMASYFGGLFEPFGTTLEYCFVNPQEVTVTIEALQDWFYNPVVYLPREYYAEGIHWIIYMWAQTPVAYPLLCIPQLPFPPNNITERNMTVVVQYKNVTSYDYGYCLDYEPVCEFEVPEGQRIVNESITCIDSTCYAEVVNITQAEETANVWAGVLNSGVTALAIFVESGLGIPEGTGLTLVWLIPTLVVGGIFFTFSASGGSIAILLMVIIGVVIGWMPLWLGVIFTVLASILVAKTVTSMVSGRG